MSKIILILFLLMPKLVLADFRQEFVPGIPDLPVPINFKLKEDSDSIFYSGEDRIITAKYFGRGTKEELEKFYDKTLVALGWKKLNNELKYSRDTEILEIKTEKYQDDKFYNILATFFLTPS